MKDLLKDAHEATLSAFRRTFDLVREYPEEEQPDRYKTASRLLSIAHDLLAGLPCDDKGYRWIKIKEFMEEKANDE